MNFFWPTRQNPEPGALGRAGRVLHWTAIIFALIPVAIGALVLLNDGIDAYDPSAASMVAMWTAFCAMSGRGLRYILAGE